MPKPIDNNDVVLSGLNLVDRTNADIVESICKWKGDPCAEQSFTSISKMHAYFQLHYGLGCSLNTFARRLDKNKNWLENQDSFLFNEEIHDGVVPAISIDGYTGLSIYDKVSASKRRLAECEEAKLIEMVRDAITKLDPTMQRTVPAILARMLNNINGEISISVLEDRLQRFDEKPRKNHRTSSHKYNPVLFDVLKHLLVENYDTMDLREKKIIAGKIGSTKYVDYLPRVGVAMEHLPYPLDVKMGRIQFVEEICAIDERIKKPTDISLNYATFKSKMTPKGKWFDSALRELAESRVSFRKNQPWLVLKDGVVSYLPRGQRPQKLKQTVSSHIVPNMPLVAGAVGRRGM